MLNFVRTEDANFEEGTGVVELAAAPLLAAESVAERAAARSVDRLDRAGMTASFICAVHCALMPLVVTLLPLLGLSFLASEPVEWTLIGCSAFFGTMSLCLGFKEHGSRRVFAILGLALALLVMGRLSHERHIQPWGIILMVAGGLTMMSAHLFNHHLCRACRRCSSHGGH